MKAIAILLVATWFLPMSVALAAEPSSLASASELLQKADDYRNFKRQSFTFDLKLSSSEPGKDDKVFQMKAEFLNSHTSLLTYVEPASERGKALLADQGNLWFYSPLSSKPIRITPQQRLLGEASNGDVASTDFSADYDSAYLRAEAIGDVPCHVLELTAKPDSLAAYNKVHLWIRADNFQPVKGDFFAVSGKVLKTAYYKRYGKLANLNNKTQLMGVEIVNALSNDKKTTMEYSNFEVKELPVSRFNVSNLSKLR